MSYAPEGVGTVTLHWHPSPRIEFDLPSAVLFRGSFGECELELVAKGVTCTGYVASMGKGGLRGDVDRIKSPKARAQQVRDLRLHVPNFINVMGNRLADGEGWYSGRNEFCVGNWRVTLDQLPGELHRKLRRSGGYVFTHVLRCKRAECEDFDPSAADELLDALDRALSFCAGRWTGGMLATGHNEEGKLVYEQWRVPWLTAYAVDRTWFPTYGSRDAIPAAIPGLLTAWDGSVAGDALHRCVHWYVEANAAHGGLEGSIVMACTGLEMLAWVDTVVRGGKSAKSFASKPVHNQVREYLARLTIPVGPPADNDVPELARFVGQEQLRDELEALIELRNRAVHPPKDGPALKSYPFQLLEQYWRYGLYLLERAILAECGYKGHVHHRLQAGWPLVEVP